VGSDIQSKFKTANSVAHEPIKQCLFCRMGQSSGHFAFSQTELVEVAT